MIFLLACIGLKIEWLRLRVQVDAWNCTSTLSTSRLALIDRVSGLNLSAWVGLFQGYGLSPSYPSK